MISRIEIRSTLVQCYSNFNVHVNPLGILLKYRFLTQWVCRDPLFCILNKIPGDMAAAVWEPTLREDFKLSQ